MLRSMFLCFVQEEEDDEDERSENTVEVKAGLTAVNTNRDSKQQNVLMQTTHNCLALNRDDYHLGDSVARCIFVLIKYKIFIMCADGFLGYVKINKEIPFCKMRRF